MLAIFLSIFFSASSISTFRLHHTREHLDCLYLYTSDGNESVSSLVPYCLGSQDVPNINRCYGQELTFDELKWNDVTATDLYAWNAPVDTINDYQMFLQNISSAYHRVYCNCTDQNWFGVNCEYTFVGVTVRTQLADILEDRYLKRNIKKVIPFVQPNTTCYQVLTCNSSICLDWRDICNGVWDCANGEDESDCTEIDIRGCKQKEFRCRNGMCIDRNFLFDGFPDCADKSDEHKMTTNADKYYSRFSPKVEENNCAWKMFSCGDGTCVDDPLSCAATDRGSVYISNLFANPHKINSNETLCWEAMICSMTAVFGSIIQSPSMNCQKKCQNYDSDCHKLRLNVCPKYYYFPSKGMTHHIPVFFMYDTTTQDLKLKDMMLPNFICFDNNSCPVSNCRNLSVIHGRRCDYYANTRRIGSPRLWNESRAWMKRSTYFSFIIRFYEHYKVLDSSKCSDKLFQCHNTDACISRFWLNDGKEDCRSSQDDEDSKMMCQLNSPDYFRCKSSKSSNECIHRKQLMDGITDCPHGDDELYPLTCDAGQSLGCEYLRNDISRIRDDMFIFQELCDGVQNVVDRKYDNNETDENDCQEWQKTCKNRGEPCLYKNEWKACIPAVWQCNLRQRFKYKPFTFKDFNQQPPVTVNKRGSLDELLRPYLSKNTTTKPPEKEDRSSSDYVLYYCNRGLLLTTRDGTDRCLCPPSYYGHSCQYQSRRVLMIVSADAAELQQRSSLVLRLVISLLTVNSDQAFSVQQVTHILPSHTSTWRHLIYLRYPNRLNSDLFYIRIDLFSVASKGVSLLSSWRYEIPFQHILPVNRVRAHLLIKPIQSNSTCSLCSHGKCVVYANIVEKSYCSCDEGWYGDSCQFKSNEAISTCALGAQVLFNNVCVCPLFTFGDKCYIQSDSQQMTCINGGTLLSESSPSLCLCPEGFHGTLCQFTDAHLLITFSENSAVEKSIPVVAIHLLDLDNGVSVTKVRRRLIFSNVQPSSTSPAVFLHGEAHLPPFIFMQFYFDANNAAGDFYLVALLKNPMNRIHLNMRYADRCPDVNTLLDSTLMTKYSILKRYKSYFKICLMNDMKCFVDEQFLCICDNSKSFECLWFDHQASNCTMNGYCQNGGHCVAPTVGDISLKFACVCAACTFGDLCQFTTAHYSISLDALIGTSGAMKSTSMFYILFGIVILFFIVGLVCNLFSFIILCRSSVQETGCAFYILCLTVVGQLGLLTFVLKFAFLLKLPSSFNQNLWSCRSIESAISFIPPLYDWLTACIAIERAVMVMQGAQFNRVRSKIIARYIAFPATILITFGSTIHKVLYRHLINDFRSDEPTWWCVVEINEPNIRVYDTVTNVIHLAVPLSINLITTIYFLLAQTRRKRLLLIPQSDKNSSYCTVLREQLHAYISFIINPAVLGLLQTPRLILSFAFVCIQSLEQVHFYIISYIVSCLPLMAGTLVLFIIPSPIYRKAIKNIFIKFQSLCHRKRRES